MAKKNLAYSSENIPETDEAFDSKWKECSNIIQKEISNQGFRTWISPIIPVGYVDNQLILRVPSQFFFEWIETNYTTNIQKAVFKIFGLNTRINYLVASSKNRKPKKINFDQEEPNAIQPKEEDTKHIEDKFGLDHRYWFDNFFCNNDNELAWKAAKTIANQPGKTDYNPFFLYGESGCGKTHLIMAIGNYISEQRKRKKIRYMTSESFLNEYIYSLQNRTLEEYNKNIKQIDVLLLDDIQFLSNKKKSQEALFYFLSEMERKRNQVVITSNEAPAHLSGFNDYLISLFQKGLIVDLVPPSFETKLAWIENYAQNNKLTLLPELKEFLAGSIQNGLQQLRAVMVRIVAHSSLLGKPVSILIAKQILGQIDKNWAKNNGQLKHIRPIKIEKIIKGVADYMNIPPDVLISFTRQREVTIARQIAIYLAREISGETLKVIGYHFNDRHYTAILHSYNKIREDIKTNLRFTKMINEIKNEFLQK